MKPRAAMTSADEFEYEAKGKDYIPIERWGKDHWSTFAYLETRAVDHHGKIDSRQMRCNPRLHREFAHIADGGEYPTRLKDGETIDGSKHDDWSCVEDMVAAGLIRSYWRVVRSGEIFGSSQARVEFTDEGLRIAARLRAHKANGKSFAEFVPA